MTSSRSLAAMARSLWLKLVNRAGGKTDAPPRRDKPKAQGAKPAAKPSAKPTAKPAEKPGRTAAKNARKAAQATRRRGH